MDSSTKSPSGLPDVGDPGRHYGADFYKGLIEGSLRSARVFVQLLMSVVSVESVVDLGCGRGAWLKAFKERGVRRLVGIDGHWNDQSNMIADLNAPITSLENERFDLAMSLEVAEHLEERSAASFVGSLTALSDLVMFSAAYSRQGGSNHVNEQPHTYWARKFLSHGFAPYDLFRPAVWGNGEIDFWYQQNTFLYARQSSNANAVLAGAGLSPLQNIAFMDCIHPELYEVSYCDNRNTPTGVLVRELVKRSLPRFLLDGLRGVRGRK
jgi:hypothetical protein